MFYTWNDLRTVAETIWGEARGEPFEGKLAVAWVIVNRAKKRNLKPYQVCLQPYQFSCWNDKDPNYPLLVNRDKDISDKVWRECTRAAIQVLGGFDMVGCTVTDRTKGATHYHTQAVMPYWAKGKEPCYVVGNHIFYNNID